MLMSNRDFLRGLALIAISLAFGLQSLRYPMGQVALAGPGLFPLVVSSLLFLVGVATVIRSRFNEAVPMTFSIRNIALIMGSLVALTVISQYVNMIAGITAMVF